MKKTLVIGALSLALALSVNTAHAKDEAAYFVLGAIVGSALTRSSAPATVYYGPAYPAPGYYAPAYAPPVVVVQQRYYHPPPRHYQRAEVRPRHPHGGPPGHRSRGR